jgi:hypothetical protein
MLICPLVVILAVLIKGRATTVLPGNVVTSMGFSHVSFETHPQLSLFPILVTSFKQS